MNTKVVAVLNIVIVVGVWPALFSALVFGMRAPGEPVTVLQNLAFAIPILAFAASLWASGYLFKSHPRLCSVSTLISLFIVGGCIYTVVTM